MWATSTEGLALIGDFSKTVATQVAPELVGQIEPWIKKGVVTDALAPSEDSDFGGGLWLGEPALAPAIIAAVSAVVSFLASEVIRAAKDESAELIRQKISALLNPPKTGKPGVPPLTAAQLQKVKTAATKQGQAFGLTQAEAENLANATIGVLALTK